MHLVNTFWAGPGFQPPPHVVEYRNQIRSFMDRYVLPAEPELEVQTMPIQSAN